MVHFFFFFFSEHFLCARPSAKPALWPLSLFILPTAIWGRQLLGLSNSADKLSQVKSLSLLASKTRIETHRQGHGVDTVCRAQNLMGFGVRCKPGFCVLDSKLLGSRVRHEDWLPVLIRKRMDGWMDGFQSKSNAGWQSKKDMGLGLGIWDPVSAILGTCCVASCKLSCLSGSLLKFIH